MPKCVGACENFLPRWPMARPGWQGFRVCWPVGLPRRAISHWPMLEWLWLANARPMVALTTRCMPCSVVIGLWRIGLPRWTIWALTGLLLALCNLHARAVYQMALSAGSAIAGLFPGQPLASKSQLGRAWGCKPRFGHCPRVGDGHQQPMHRKEEFRHWRDAQCAMRQIDPGKAKVTVAIGWLQHGKQELCFLSMAVAALKNKEESLRVVKKAKTGFCWSEAWTFQLASDTKDFQMSSCSKVMAVYSFRPLPGLRAGLHAEKTADRQQVVQAVSAPRELKIPPS
eukprot:365978-Chlamydomonas_euryale.AAC.12